MKICIISLSVLYYITFLNQWNFVESQSPSGGSTTPDSDGSSPASTNPNPVTTDTITPVTLDINKSNDTNELYFKKDGNFRTFTPKPNLTITKIVKKSLEIWNAEPEDHGLKAVLMGSGRGEKHLSILLQSGNFVLLRKCGKGECWEDITKEKSDFSGVKMYSLEEGTSNYHELTGNDYDPIIFESRYGYEFKDGVKCVKITYNNETMWSHTDDAEFGYLKGLYLDLPKDQFSVTNLKDQVKHFHKVDDKWVSVTTIALNLTTNHSTDQFDYLKNGNFHTYTPKSGCLFVKVSQGTKVIWEPKDDVFGILVRTMTICAVKYLIVLLTDNSFKLFNLDSAKNKSWEDITKDRYDVKKLKLLGDNDVELSKTDYTITIVNYSYQHTFKPGVKCVKITYNDELLWSHTDDTSFSDIKSFSLGLASNKFFVKNQSNQTKELDFKPTGTTASQTQSAKPATTPTQGTPTTPTNGGTQPSGSGTPASQSQPAKPASTPTSGTQPPRASGTGRGTPASPSQSSTPASQPTTPSSGTDTPASETPTTP
uniref:SfiI-subtelomeric related protein family member n=1 Tax=Theileria annulata TaxID=5874 RepID=A0A3B0N5H8_THEAN